MKAKPMLLLVLSISVLLLVPKGAAGQAYTINKTLDSGDPTTHIDLAIIGSGFAPSELGAYIAKADGNIAQMFSVNWFSANRNLFNVWRIDASSPQSGTDLDDATIYSMASHVPYDILIVLHNYDGQENVNKPYVELYTSSDSYVVLAHELGHKIGQLGDEYVAAGTCTGLSKMFINIHDKPNNEKWSNLISTPPVEGAMNCATGLWRPSANSIMRDSANTRTFDAVGLRAMDLGAGKMLGTVESTAPSLSISGLNDGDTKSGILTIQAVTSDASGIDRVEFYWAKAGDTSRSIKIDRAAPYDLSVDTTQYPNGQYYLDTLSYDSNWNYARKTMLFTVSNSPPSGTLITPIIVQEALPSGVSGLDRTNEPLTAGIPLAEDSGITNVSQLSLSGASIHQFRPLAYWPNGNIKWVLVDTQTMVPAGGQSTINLMSTANNPPGAGMASDQGSYILINTGVAQFRIKKANFNMIDQAIVNGQELVSPGNQGGLSLLGFNNVTYDSKNDASSTATIEENGPARAVVKSMGSLKDSSGNRFIDYTIRLYFYKDESYAKTDVILRNGAQEGNNPTSKTFSSFQVNIPLNLGATKQFEFATKTGMVSGTISNSVYMFQAFSVSKALSWAENDAMGGNLGWWYPPMKRLTSPGICSPVSDPTYGSGCLDYEQKGVEIKNGGTTLRSLSNETDWAKDYGEIKDSSGAGLTVAMQYMSAYWPASIEFNVTGSVEIGLFSKYNSKKDIMMGWGTHETREMMLDFHTSAVNNQLSAYRIEEPLTGRASTVQYYMDTKALFWDEMPTAQEHDQWWLANSVLNYYHPMPGYDQTNQGFTVWRNFWYVGVVGQDTPLAEFYTFLRTGYGGRYLGGLQKATYMSDSATSRTDGFDLSQSGINLGAVDCPEKEQVPNRGCYNRGGGMNHFDPTGAPSHNHWLAMPLYYYQTGDEDFKEAVNDYMEEFIQRDSQYGFKSLDGDLRTWSRYYRTVALGYEFTGDARLKASLEAMTNKLLDSRDNPPNVSPYGRNLQRGYMYNTDPAYLAGLYGLPAQEIVHSFFLYSIHAEDVGQAIRVLKAYDQSYPRTEELEDYLLGVGQFMYNEPFMTNPANPSQFAVTYEYLLNQTNVWGQPYGAMSEYDESRAMLTAYQKTDDPKYLNRGKQILACPGPCYGGAGGGSQIMTVNELIYVDLHGIGEAWQYVSGVSSAKNPDGTYTLRWTVPQGATAYQVKYSDKPIVDWLGFNQTTRAYQYDPSQYTAFFAATNIDNEPAPGAAGSAETYTIDLSQAASSYDSARSLAPSNPSYVSYSPSKQYYFSVKYLSAQAGQTQALSITTTSLPNGQTLSAYSQALSASGGTSPYTWSLISGSLPPGLSLSPAGLISDTPTSTGAFSFTVQARDSASNTSSKALSITVGTQPPTQTCQSQGYQCCSSCQSGPHSQYDSTCSGSQACCDSCGGQQTSQCGNIVLLHHYDNNPSYGESPALFYDFSGNGNNGTCSGGNCPSYDNNGKFGKCLSFDGIDDYADLPNGNAYMNASAGTIALWYKAGANSGAETHYLYYYNFGGCSSISIELLGYSPTTIRARHFINCQGTADWIDTTVDNWGAAQGSWHFFAFTWDVPNDTLSTFYDGAYKSQADDLDTGNLGPANSVIGSVAYGHEGTQSLFKGLIDDFQIRNSALTNQEMQSIYSSGQPASCPSKADTNQDGCISMAELNTFIFRWKVSNIEVTLKELMDAIGLWKKGGC